MLASRLTSSSKSGTFTEELEINLQSQEQIWQQQELLRIINLIQAEDFWEDNNRDSFDELLNNLMKLTKSRYGFIGTVNNYHNRISRQSHINISVENDKEFYACLETALQTKQPQISEVIERIDSSLYPYIGIPVLFQNEVLIVVGLAGRISGYNQGTIDLLQPLLKLLGRLHFQQIQQSKQTQLISQNTKWQEDWNSLMLTLDDIVMEINDQKIFTHVWCRQDHLLFKPREEFIGKTINETLGEHASYFDQMADEVLKTGVRQEYVYKDIRQEVEKWYRIKMSLFENTESSSKRLLLLIRDVTTQESQKLNYEHTQTELKRSNQLLSICQQMSKMGGWEFNVNTGQLFWTAEIYKMREIPQNYSISLQSAIGFYHPEDRPVYEAARENLFYNYEPYDLELRHISAKGKQTWVRTIGVPILNQRGMATHFRGIIMDITDKKDAELQLVNARDNAQKAAQSRSEFLSVMSHEIRTPLNAIIGIAGILNGGTSDAQGEIIQTLQFSARHLLGLINDILDFTKMEAGKIELEHIPFNPTALLQGITRNHQPLAKSKGIKLYTSFDDTIPENIIGDPVRLGQIINNLLNNAIKFTQKGYVSIEVQQEACTNPDYCALSFEVKDTGIGISEDMQEKIFDSFVQENSAISRLHGGTGLGLAITKKLINLYNSNIILESKKDEGTTFRFDISFLIPKKNSIIHSNDEQSDNGCLQDKKILIIEDNPINIRILELQLQATGAIISSACNGKVALQKMKEDLYDGIILDLHMPEMNGYETIPHIKEWQPTAFIIVLTADIMPDVRKRLNGLGVKNMLPKPYAPEDLLRMLQCNVE
ncbi:response regulator [Chitinophaga silvatica]|uniref:histidine kinase n=1 Tax=Chitinophaga silvatica TaxID=2282649 RepID=A0A3E1YG16_9BACT|nr:ATP-binding protein [Chitinophaga silvatica]RFS26324.1 response regulator [Chitinophaga silvatica]